MTKEPQYTTENTLNSIQIFKTQGKLGSNVTFFKQWCWQQGWRFPVDCGQIDGSLWLALTIAEHLEYRFSSIFAPQNESNRSKTCHCCSTINKYYNVSTNSVYLIQFQKKVVFSGQVRGLWKQHIHGFLRLTVIISKAQFPLSVDSSQLIAKKDELMFFKTWRVICSVINLLLKLQK